MPENWKTYKLGEVALLKRGYDLPERLRKQGKYQIISSSGITDSHVDFKVKGPGVVTGRYGTIGKVFFTNEDFWPLNTSLYVQDFNGNDSKFIYYLFHTIKWHSYSTKSAVPGIDRNEVHQEMVKIPPLQEQRAIASILSALEDKIELNLQMNKTLEEMSMALYKHWFVNFGAFQNGKFVESELGMIPEGWEVKRLDEVCSLTIGRTPPRKETKWFSQSEGVKWISIKDIGNSGSYIFQTSEYLSEEAVKKFNIPIIKPNTVILSFKLTVGRVAISNERMLSNEAIAHLNRKEERTPVEFLYSYLRLFNFNSLGSTSSIATAVNTQTLKAMKILLPTDILLSEYANKVVDIFRQIKNNQLENQTLTTLRDTLLPKLISGQIRVKDAEQMVAASL